MYDILQLNEMLVPELKEIAEQLALKGYKRLSKQDLIYKILDHQAVSGADTKTEVVESKAEVKTESKQDNDKKQRRRRDPEKKDAPAEMSKPERAENANGAHEKSESKPKKDRGAKSAGKKQASKKQVKSSKDLIGEKRTGGGTIIAASVLASI